MGSTTTTIKSKVLIGGLLVSLALVGFASAADEIKCSTPSGKSECKKDLKKDQWLHVQCPQDATFEPADAFAAPENNVCKKSLGIDDTCGSDTEKLNTLVPGVELSYPEGTSKKYDFKIRNKNELSNDTMVYATCKNSGGSAGFAIAIKFYKGSGSDASSRSTMPAVLLGALATLAVMLRA